MGLSTWANLWIFLVATIGGGAGAGLTFRVMNPDDR